MTLHKLFTFIIIFYSAVAFAQKGSNSNQSIDEHKNKIKYKPQTIIVKFKPLDQLKIQKIDLLIPLLKNLPVKAETVLKMFEKAEKPLKEVNHLGQKLADLSRTYIISYSAPFEVAYACKLLEQTNLVEYAEPYYYHEILVMPNDPAVQNGNDQFYLDRIKAYDAWNLTKGDTNVVIGIIDTGAKLDHEDLKDNFKYNLAEKNGKPNVDDDKDGYVDNILGWDFGNNDNNPDATGNEHGTCVSSIAAATTNNGKGMAGVGYNCKIMPIKASNDAKATTISYGYEALFYAANHGVKVVNLSFGGPGIYSRTSQDIVTYAAVNKDVVIIAAAGNSNLEESYYPASYKYVISVAASDTITSATTKKVLDKKADLATYSYDVDLCAQGKRVYLATNTGSYDRRPGSSFASPLVAGAAGLLRSYKPKYTALQVMEQMRITGDIVDTFPETKQYKEKYGRRLNIWRALTDTLIPSVRMDDLAIGNSLGNLAPGDTADLWFSFVNYLYPTSNCKVTLRSLSPYVTLIDSTTTLGAIATMGFKVNNDDPFSAVIAKNIPVNHQVTFRLQFDDGSYHDFQYFRHIFNPAFLTVTTADIKHSIGEGGRVENTERSPIGGQGFVFNNRYLLFEAGLMIGLNDSVVSDRVRGSNPDLFDYDFMSVGEPRFISPAFSSQQIRSNFNDNGNPHPIGISVEENTYAWHTAGDSKYTIVEYKIKNNTGAKIDSLHAGIFADWDIMNSSRNRADWSASNNLGYAYSTEANGIYAGISLISPGKPTYFAMDHISTLPDNIFPNDSFTSEEKFATMKNGVSKTKAGVNGSGTDISHVVGAKIYNLAPGETKKIAFAFVAGFDLESINTTAVLAKEKYKSFNTGPLPVLNELTLCNGKTVDTTVTPANGTSFNIYNNNALVAGNKSKIVLENISMSDTLLISNVDSLFESKTAPLYIRFTSAATAGFEVNPAELNLAVNSKAEFINKSTGFTSSLWNFGDNTTPSTLTNPEHIYTTTGIYQISLEVKDLAGCIAVKTDTFTVNYIVSTSDLNALDESLKIYPVPATDFLEIETSGMQEIQGITIINSLGTEVFHKVSDKPERTLIDLREKPAGIYFVNITTRNGKITRSFVKN